MLSISKPFARTVEALLGVMAILTFLLIYAMHIRSQRLYADPRSIAALAVLFQQRQLITDIQDIDSSASNKEIRKILSGQKYGLHHYKQEHGSPTFGLLRLGNSQSSPKTDIGWPELDLTQGNVLEPEIHVTLPVPATPSNCRAQMHRFLLSAFTAVLASLLSIVIYYHTLSENNAFERFMDSRSFGVRFLFTTIGVVIKITWIHLSRGE